jgi:hypothetical protein
MAENGATNAYMGGAHLNGFFKIGAHPHRQRLDAVTFGYFAQ